MAADTWTVVKFKIENSVEAILTTWLLENDRCYWPPFTQEKIQQAIKKHDQPNKCWALHTIIKLRYSRVEHMVFIRHISYKISTYIVYISGTLVDEECS